MAPPSGLGGGVVGVVGGGVVWHVINQAFDIVGVTPRNNIHSGMVLEFPLGTEVGHHLSYWL